MIAVVTAAGIIRCSGFIWPEKISVSVSMILCDVMLTVTTQWVPWRLKSPASGLFAQSFVQSYIRETHSASLAFVRGFHRWLTNSPHKRQVTRIMFPFDDVIMFMTLWTEKCFREVLHCDNNWIKETSSLRVTVHQNCQCVAYRACFLFIFT